MKKIIGWEWKDEVPVIRSRKEYEEFLRTMKYDRRIFIETRNYRIGGELCTDGEFIGSLGFNWRKRLNEEQKKAVRELQEAGFRVQVRFDSCADGYFVVVYCS